MKLFFKLLPVLFLLGCSTSDLATLEREDFSIAYPLDYKLDETGTDGVTFVIFAPHENESDNFAENINLIIADAENLNFDEYISLIEEQMTSVAEVKLMEKERLKINGSDCFRMICETKEDSTELKFIQHYYLVNHKVYLLTFTSEKRAYEDHLDEMNNVLFSFKIKG